jgi:hypothetical protein
MKMFSDILDIKNWIAPESVKLSDYTEKGKKSFKGG